MSFRMFVAEFYATRRNGEGCALLDQGQLTVEKFRTADQFLM
jgi:hypothetical protein